MQKASTIARVPHSNAAANIVAPIPHPRFCFNVALTKPLTDAQKQRLRWLLSETFDEGPGSGCGPSSFIAGGVAVAGGVTMILLGDDDTEPAASPATGRLRLGVAPAGVMLTGAW